MKRAVIACFSTLVALSMTGCPIYPSDNLCHTHLDCAPGYSCDQGTGACLPPPIECARPADCTNANETCSPNGTCEIGSCRLIGCVAGYQCLVFGGTWACTLGTGAGGASSVDAGGTETGGAASDDASAGGSTSGGDVDAGN